MTETLATHLAVIGGGPGGYAAAFLAADRGVATVLIDAAAKPGGTCLHAGCIPSKALLHVAQVIRSAADAAAFGVRFAPPEIDVAQLRDKISAIVDSLATNLVELCRKRGIRHIAGRASFVDANTVEVDSGLRVRFRNALIATGSTPMTTAAFALRSPRVLDSTSALALDSIPRSLLVIGGGYIGLELGSVYAALGSEVTVVELTGGLLPGVDRDLVQPLLARLSKQFRQIHLNTKVTELTETARGIEATFEGEVAEKKAAFDKVLVAIGRRPNSGNLGL
ncbi:MAG: NAD(P)/FAD-dependent oxidoreductase, partial [Gemmataceae bacterium]|nr:NAD(P)/FAD-dependent oxidoreductase [Gemmataceae bacterium]